MTKETIPPDERLQFYAHVSYSTSSSILTNILLDLEGLTEKFPIKENTYYSIALVPNPINLIPIWSSREGRRTGSIFKNQRYQFHSYYTTAHRESGFHFCHYFYFCLSFTVNRREYGIAFFLAFSLFCSFFWCW